MFLLCPAIIATVAALSQPAAPPALQLSVPTFADTLKKTKDKVSLAEAVRRWFGSDNLKNGAWPKEDNLNVAFAITATGVEKGKEPRLVTEDNSFTLPLKQIGDSDVWAASVTLAEGQAFRYIYEVNGAKKGEWRDIEVYTKPPEMNKQAGVPEGTITEMPQWKSTILAGTTRHWWVYVPKQYTADTPANVLVCQDGNWSHFEMPVVLDNMIAHGDIPPTVAIFVEPGTKSSERDNRNFEYDTLNDTYARMIVEEILPEVAKSYKLRDDAAGRAISGVSSGGICAFTVAWEKPEAFGNVISGVGSFVNLQYGGSGIVGGHCYPPIIRKTKDKPKPIRVFLSDGRNDIDNQFGNWPLANQTMDKALTYAGYDHRFVFGNGFHNGKFNMIQMPTALRYIWGKK